ncbi:sperm-associated antigen 17-like [Oopsacas minuta]|uniref:Sperm-associated antigen 17-like n=1 Tax=Oopsacas minuta TaxID=111878 RepID=A0AAV7JMY7_9METZ|nr:sperm-associated antigen 17-like [Oopsacas minuta]
MSKAKKGKEVGKGSGTGGPRWDEQLIQESLDTDSWRLCICVIAGVDTCSEEFVTALAKQISSLSREFKQRRKFYSLSYQEVIKKALEGSTAALSKSQASKGKGKGAASPVGSRPPGSEALADLVKSQTNSEEGVTADTVARAIKMSLLMLRQDDVLRRQQDAIREGRPGSGALSPSKKKVGKVTPTSKGKQGKTGKGVEEGIPMPTKPESILRKRGEEVGEIVFIEDEPSQGPEAYLLLSGVKNADVISEMGRIGVPPGCLMRVSGGERGVEQGEFEEEEREKRNKSDESIKEFWNTTDRVLDTARESGVRDTGLVIVDYTVDPEQDRVQTLYDQVANHIYQLIEQKRLHKQYLDSLSLADVTSNRVTSKNTPGLLYREQLHGVPNQCSSVDILMDAMLQQVCVSDVTQVPSTDIGDSKSTGLQESLNRIKQKPNIGSKYVSEKTIRYPVIYEGDHICERESILEAPAHALDKRGVERQMLDNYKAAQLLKKFPQLQQDDRSRVDARYQQLLRLSSKSVPPLSHNQLQSLLIMLSFAEMVHSPSQQLFDDPYPDTNRQESVDSLTPVIANMQWSEPLTRDVIYQRIQTALSPDRGYPTCVTKYHRQSDKLLILFHPLSLRNEWNARLLTPTGFYLYQRFLHSDISPLVDRIWQLNSFERDKLLETQDLTPNQSQVSLTQISTPSGEKDKSKDGRGSSHSKNTIRTSRSSRLKSSRVSSSSVERVRDGETAGSREDLLSAQKSEIEQKLLLLTGYDLGYEWYAGRGSSSKIELNESEFISSEQRAFYSTPHSSITMQYSHESGVLAGISLLLDNKASNITRDNTDDVISPVTVLEPILPILYASYRVSLPTGVKLSLSPYGKLGGLPPPKQMLEDEEIRLLEEEHIRTPSPGMPPMTSESKLGGKGGRGKKTDDQMAVEQHRQLTEERDRRRREIERLKEEKLLKFKRENKYQTLFASTEYGLQVTCSSKVRYYNSSIYM